MSRFILALAGALFLGATAQPVAQSAAEPPSRPTVQPSNRPAVQPPAPWLQGDPGDSLYRVAREALNRGRYREALDAFRQLERTHPKSGYVADGLYWQAFALYRLGGRANLQQALERLQTQERRFADAGTRGDADALAIRVKSLLAQLGDLRASEDLLRQANRAPVATVAPTEPLTRAPGAARAVAPVIAGMGMSDDCGEDNDVKVMALQGIMRNNPERALPILEKVMARRDPESACLRRHALFVLATSNDPKASEMLLNVVMSDPDKEVRENAVFWLSRTQDPRAVAVLDSVLRTSKDQDVQQAAIFALGTKDDPAARNVLRSYITRNGITPELAGMALFQVARDPATTPAQLQQFYAQASSTEMKQQILVAMMTRKDVDSKWLMQVATDKAEDQELRQQAIMLLVRSDLPTTDLLKLFDSLPADDEMQGMMVMLMAQRPNDPAITDRLITVAKTSKDKELRQQAIFWLSQSKDPRATKLLEEMLEQ